MDAATLGLFVATWVQILPLYFYMGKLMARLNGLNYKK